MYLIKEGEFELSKKIKRDLRVDIDYSQFMSKEQMMGDSDKVHEKLA